MKKSNALKFEARSGFQFGDILLSKSFAATLCMTLSLTASLVSNAAMADDSINVKSVIAAAELKGSSSAINPSTAIETDVIGSSAASTTSIDGASSTSSTNAALPATSSIFSNFTARADEVYYGASLNNLGNSKQPNDVSTTGAIPVFIRSNVGVGYNLSPSLLVGAVARVDYFPKANNNYAWDDCYLRLMAPKLIDHGNFSMVGDLRVYVPTSQFSRMTGLLSGIQTRLVPNYNIPNSRFSVGAIFFHEWYVRDGRVDSLTGTTSSGASNTPFAQDIYSSEAYAGPNVAFQMTPTIAFSVLYELDAVRVSNSGSMLNYVSDTHSGNGYTDLLPGVSWDITPNVNLNPFLTMYPGSNFSMATTNINVVLGIKLL